METKRIVISWCRDYDNYQEAKKYIDFFIKEIRKKYELIFVSGGCRGADKSDESYAAEHGYKIEVYPAEAKKVTGHTSAVR